jgi:hypothetical protein
MGDSRVTPLERSLHDGTTSMKISIRLPVVKFVALLPGSQGYTRTAVWVGPSYEAIRQDSPAPIPFCTTNLAPAYAFGVKLA